MKLALVVIVLAACAGLVAREHVWLHGGARPLVYRDATLADFETAHPLSKVTVHGDEERVLVSPGPRSSGGYALDVVEAEVERGRVLVVVRERTPTLGEPGRPGVAYPYRLLVFRKIDKPVHVGWEGRP